MKAKSVDKVIVDIRELFGIDTLSKVETWKKGLHEMRGTFFIYKERFKRKKVDKILDRYFDKVEIKDGKFEKLGKSIAYSMFKISKNEKKKKGEKEKGRSKKN